jgi:hypothetical protein
LGGEAKAGRRIDDQQDLAFKISERDVLWAFIFDLIIINTHLKRLDGAGQHNIVGLKRLDGAGQHNIVGLNLTEPLKHKVRGPDRSIDFGMPHYRGR